MQVKIKRWFLTTPLMLVVTLILAACSGNSTATNVPANVAANVAAVTTVVATTEPAIATTVAATTAPAIATTVVATTVAATTEPAIATTVVATTVAATTEPAIATTVAATTAPAIATTVAAQAATTAAASPTVIANNSAGRENRIAINIAGATEIKPSATFGIMLGKLIPGQTNPNVQFYASDDESDKLANNADSAFVEAGYKFGLPGQNKPLKHEHTIVGFYTKSGSPDLLIAAATVQDDTSDITKALRVPGMTAEEISRLTEEVKNKRSLMVIIAAPKLLESTLIAAMGNTTPTPDSNSSGPEIGEKDVPVYAGSKRIIPASGLVDGVTSLYYTSNDNYEKMVVWAKKAFIEKGWTEVSIFESESKVVTAITGKKNGYSLLGTIVSSSKVHGSRGYDSVLKLVNIGPNDSVIAIVVGKY